ncbi:MAG TPA: hypothetical protein VGN47_15060 [Blastococcus sp.]|nr:hypothetical protein [Blastococcus sp.]
MSARWVAGTVRARAMAHRRIGAGGARALAASPSLEDALATLSASPYGHDVRTGQTLAEAQRAVGDTLLWNLRVFAGWLPPDGGRQLRLLAGWFEIANVEELLRGAAGGPAAAPFRLGALATVAPRLAAAGSPAELRRVLAASPWGDPGGEAPADVVPALRLAWAERVAGGVPPARPWALAGGALLVARELFVAGRPLPAVAEATARRLLGRAATTATTPAGFAAVLPRPAREALAGVTDPPSLWRAEARWWTRLDSDAAALLRRPRFTADPVVGAVGAAAADAWRVCAALECAARGGQELEVFDAVA